MSTPSNRQYRLAARPVGLPRESDWSFTSEPVPAPEDGQVLVKVLQLSLDPAMRSWMNEGKSYIAPVGIGEVMRAGGVGVVIESRHPRFAIGDHVAGLFGIQDYCLVDLREGSRASLQKSEDIIDGLERFPEALNRLFSGENFGKLVLGVARR
jgi:NADPH-dependent curcumin reductase CurA